MKEICSLVVKIRDLVNELDLFKKRFQNNLKDWNRLCSSMDYVEDTCEACTDYEGSGFGKKIGGKYLRLYGFLQSIFLQQDAISTLSEIFLTKSVNSNPPKNWKRIRDLRNMSAGHPVEYNYGSKSVFLSRVALVNNSVQLLVWNNTTNKDRFKDVNITQLYKGYITEANTILREIKRGIK